MNSKSPLEKLREASARAAELRPEEQDLTDEELLAKHPLPEPLAGGSDPDTPVAVLVEDAPPEDMPQVYGPIRIGEVYETTMNAVGKLQAKAQGRITINGKEARLLVSGFHHQIAIIEALQPGATYHLKGRMTRKVTFFNGEKTVSLFLNLTA
jgi:hypothetical protein